MADYTVRDADWRLDEASLRAVRHDVFVVEQAIPAALEWDGIDPGCVHALAVDAQGTAIGCGRLLPDGHVGRMAVRAAWRGRGVGSALLVHLVERSRARGDAQSILNAQARAVPFYARHGYAVVGEPFDEAGIPHVVMARPLPRR